MERLPRLEYKTMDWGQGGTPYETHKWHHSLTNCNNIEIEVRRVKI